MIDDAMKLYDDAIHDLTTAISLDQNWIELLVDRGKVFAKEDRFDAAISDFNRAIERNGNLTWAIRERGLTYKRMGDKEKARDVVSTLIRTGTIRPSDFVGQQTYVLGDGTEVPSDVFTIRSLKVGNLVVENVRANIASPKAMLLLGQSFLRHFKQWSVDNSKHSLLSE